MKNLVRKIYNLAQYIFFYLILPFVIINIVFLKKGTTEHYTLDTLPGYNLFVLCVFTSAYSILIISFLVKGIRKLRNHEN